MIYHHHGGEDFQEHAVQAWQRKMQSDVKSGSGATRSQCLHMLQKAIHHAFGKERKRSSQIQMLTCVFHLLLAGAKVTDTLLQPLEHSLLASSRPHVSL